MVSSLLADAVRDPVQALTELYATHASDDFPETVAAHFSDIFTTPAAFSEVPRLDVSHPPEIHGDRALVRFRAMVQDTSPSPEMYLASLGGGRPGGWGMEAERTDDQKDVDFNDLRECAVLWAVSVPGETEWCSKELDGPDAEHPTPNASTSATRRHHKFPLGEVPHVGVQIKLYNTHGTETLKSTEVVTFVGLLTTEPLSTSELDAPIDVPTLHVLFMRRHAPALIERPYADSAPAHPIDALLRAELIDWLAEEALGGDRDAAEWTLLACLGRVQSRHPPLLPPTLTLARFPPPPAPADDMPPAAEASQESSTAPASPTTTPPAPPLPTLSNVLALLLPLVHTLPLSLAFLNNASFTPHSESEDLHAGHLQLTARAALLLAEGALDAGTLHSRGVANVRAAQDVMTLQKVAYEFPFSRFEFDVEIVAVVLAPGRASALFKTDTTVCLHPRADADLYKPAAAVRLPPPEKLEQFRTLIAGARGAKALPVDVETRAHIEQDFVRERQQAGGAAVTVEELSLRMTMAKLRALSLHEKELTINGWEETKKLDARRKAALE